MDETEYQRFTRLCTEVRITTNTLNFSVDSPDRLYRFFQAVVKDCNRVKNEVAVEQMDLTDVQKRIILLLEESTEPVLVKDIAWRTGYAIRTIQNHCQLLADKGLIVNTRLTLPYKWELKKNE